MKPDLKALLRATSRSFYLTLRMLPGPVRPQVELAYLLARTSDTIADTELVPVSRRLEALTELDHRIQQDTGSAIHLGSLAQQTEVPAEKILLERVEEIVLSLQELSQPDRQLVRTVLATIISGQALDLRRFGQASGKTPEALETEAELDDYTYRVAGCVGEFWTRICRAHLFPKAVLDEERLLHNGVRFGQGLQLVNILRDIAKDLRNGRCYLPRQSLIALQLTPADLLDSNNQARVAPLYRAWLAKAESHLAAGWDYVNALPPGQFRLRLACAWPILIGARTLGRLRNENVFDSTRRIKVSRSEIYALMRQTLWRYPRPESWRRQFEEELNRPAASK